MRRPQLALALVLALASVPAFAQDSTDPTRKPDEDVVMSSEAFLGAHPDMKYRLHGMHYYGERNWTRALEDFRRAARYGDKPSQAMLGEMHWNGEGVAVDRSLAYVWMDLAAERAYPTMLAKREHYWNKLTAAERERALALGEEMYAEYGDTAAKPRLERLLRQARRGITGSRVGSVGNLLIQIPTPSGMREVRGDSYYQEKFWKPEQYWEWQDYDWKGPARGEVTVGDVLTDNGPPPEDE